MRRTLASRRRPLVALPAVLLAACGSGGGSSGASPTAAATASATPTATAAATVASTATPTPAPPALLVWVVGTGGSGGSEVRTVPVGGGSAHVVAALPADALVLAAGSGKLAVAFNDHTIHVIDLAGGAVDTYPVAGAPATVVGGAFSPDGKRFAFVAATATPLGGSLQVLDLVTKASTAVRSFPSNTVDVPQRWNGDAMVGTAIVAFADAGPQALVRLDPVTGARLASSDITGSGAVAIAPDGVHAAVSKHNHLGDDGDSPGGPGPAQPFNTLRTASIGAAPVDVFQEPHHQVVPLALSATGDTICFSDDPAAGAFAGITQSPAFGLFLRSGTTSTQLAHWDGSRWDRGMFVGSAVAVANHTSAAEKLELVSAGGAPSTLDTVSGGDEPVFLGLA
ncbi:MAG TPA: hypothetical protein VN193_00250 [Candidatus Angelobacter sp.]|jgi:hypothetical protein|nr:hypothetical protein [Candidatus Angelobacter sp.]